jgi:uncharacterized membrane protein
VTGFSTGAALVLMPWESPRAMALSAAVAVAAGVLAFLGVRRGGPALRGALWGGKVGGTLGFVVATALLYLPAFSEEETRPVDAILGIVILGFYSLGALWAWRGAWSDS